MDPVLVSEEQVHVSSHYKTFALIALFIFLREGKKFNGGGGGASKWGQILK